MAEKASVRVTVAVDLPQHSGLAGPLDYLAEQPVAPGRLVRVPLGRREVLGIVWPQVGETMAGAGTADAEAVESEVATPVLRTVRTVLDGLPPLAPRWLDLVAFAARYYQRGIGELALAVLPPELRTATFGALARRIDRMLAPPTQAAPKRRRAGKAAARKADAAAAVAVDAPQADEARANAVAEAEAEAGDAAGPTAVAASPRPDLSPEQAAALARIAALDDAAPGVSRVVLLHGVTGSGKTEVYLRAAERVLAAGRQVLLLVPEINLTPQLQARVAARFGGGAVPRRIVTLHSGLTPVQRLEHWLAAQLGQADLVLGTRLAVFAPLARLGLIVVDEEHDPSYKQQEGARYSARDLAVYRGRLEGACVLLGSATPSLESWHHAETGRYLRIDMPSRIGGGALPAVRRVDMNRQAAPAARGAPPAALAPVLLEALKDRLARGEQSLVLLNRRGYAPVLRCGNCGWQSDCPHCSAWQVFHKRDRTLRCHHCGMAQQVPRYCPECSNADIAAVGRGTERLEEQLAELLPEARIARIDADSMRRKGALEAGLEAVHAGRVDILVGTQMVAKGHDFRNVTLVAAVSPDSAIFTSDFRAPERLFALLMQAAGRAGRDAAQAGRGQMWVQTWHPAHPLFEALACHDFAAFAAAQLAERRSAGLPPFSHLALLRADARTAEAARRFLDDASALGQALPEAAGVAFYAPVPMAVARVADVERMQLLVESASRAALQKLLAAWVKALPALHKAQRGGDEPVLRWAVDVDPLAI